MVNLTRNVYLAPSLPKCTTVPGGCPAIVLTDVYEECSSLHEEVWPE